MNSISANHSSKGEVFNRNGKTDILLFDSKGNNIFIAECKIWKGQVMLLDAIDQLLGLYVNWRDEKTALIIFNKDMQKFSDLIDNATKAVAGHPLSLKYLGCRTETSYTYIFKNSTDDKKTIKL